MTAKAWFNIMVIAVLLAAGFGGGWSLNGLRLDARASKLAATTAKEAAKRSTDYLDQLRAVTAAKKMLADELAASDKRFTDQKRVADAEIERLNTCVRTGECGLRVHASCPPTAPGGVMPPAGPGSGVDTATGPKLDTDAERDYFALRKALTVQFTQLGACVNALGRITGQLPAANP